MRPRFVEFGRSDCHEQKTICFIVKRTVNGVLSHGARSRNVRAELSGKVAGLTCGQRSAPISA